ncbi:hypothetical protein [Paracoccus yeei]|uniref:Uncharacterized protein n=1 Tax=Paracoccus yeei TaxID=147645 RepID=A0A2D2C3Z8_9RHOB|nr:hypothetical protein [Paracoccus yeei]ATQ57244.1 hypothetical protein PYTT13_16530 [Paracoccus yeei]
MTRYEPYCDCLGGHVDMRPDPNGRWFRAEVKPLEWMEYDADCYFWKAPLFGEVLVKRHWKGHWVVVWSTPGYTGLFCPGHFATADEAKAAAQSRILSALVEADHA